MRSGNCKCSTRNQKGVPMRDEKSLAHTRWNCKYHIVFAPKYRRQVFYREKRRAIGVTNGAIVIHTQRLKSDPGGNLLS
ncbi:transposase for the insertion element [Yersinia pestis Angola]|nr:transposase for the insertion element [Yersinia pestis Angola]